jgi:formate hydrogenlyase subunit 3/multisubunit Na+/H+ antiporter MnhD subunit
VRVGDCRDRVRQNAPDRVTLPHVSLPLALALVDAAAGLYLLYALRRQRRNREALAVTAVFLLLCAAALGWLALPERDADEPGRLPAPTGELA